MHPVSESDSVETILVVDDDEQVRQLAARMLEKQGYCVIEAESGTVGLERFSQHHEKVDLVLSDVLMPKMSGPEMIQRILTINPSTRVMLMTGYSVEAILPKTVPIVAKPFTLEVLVETVRACLAA
jgi:DNA-binding NtrC family response regulator